MKLDRELDEILGEIGNEHRAIEAPKNVEALLRIAVEQRKVQAGLSTLRPAWAWGFVVLLVAAIACSGLVWKMRSGNAAHDGQVARQSALSAVEPAETEPQSISATVPPPRLQFNGARQTASATLRSAKTSAAQNHDASAQDMARNSLQEFVPLPVSEGLPPATQMSVVRVKLQGSDLQQYGLQAPADASVRTLLAEFVVGEDGLPRAIRIIQ